MVLKLEFLMKSHEILPILECYLSYTLMHRSLITYKKKTTSYKHPTNMTADWEHTCGRIIGLLVKFVNFTNHTSIN